MTAPRARPRWLGEFLLLSAIWGASFLFMRVAVVEFGAIATAAMRVTVAALFLLPLLLMRRQGSVLLAHWWPLLFIGILNSAIPFACFAFALLYITTGLSAILNATVPLFGALIAWVWLGERLNALRVLGLVLGFAGVAMLAWDEAHFGADASGMASAWAVAAGLLATVCYAVAANFTRRHLAGVPALVTATGSQVGATIGLAAPAIWLWPAQSPGVLAWAAVAAVGVVSSGIAYILYFRLIESAGATRALSVTFVVPVFAILYGALLLSEPVTGWMILCGTIIVAGTALSAGLIRPQPDAEKSA